MLEKLVKLRYVWFVISLLIIVPGLISLALNGLRPSIDFAGGSLWELHFPGKQASDLSTDAIARAFAEQGFEGPQVQLSSVEISGEPVPVALVRTKALDANDPNAQRDAVQAVLNAEYGEVRIERLESVGATVSRESTRSAIIAVISASTAILIYLTFAFRLAPHPFRYGICAILAMLHDLILVLGVASILGVLIGLEVDALFLTALLTVISFSVHDTIVVFDRIRENLISKRASESFDDIVNHSIVQTLPRSMNTQLTSLFTLAALLLFGGQSIRNFVLILMIGLLSGTFSSIFNAAQLLVVWEHREWRNWFGRKKATEQATA
jgi:preprotein translocase subunit SecF